MKKSRTFTPVLALLAALFLAAGPAFAQTQETRPPLPPAKATPPVQAVEPLTSTPVAPAPVDQAVPPARTPSSSDGAAAASPVAVAAEAAPPQAATKPPSNMRTELIKISYLESQAAYNLLRAYSTTNRVSLSDPMSRMIVVTDTSEVISKMIQVIKEYDVKPAEIQFAVQIVQGGDGESDETLKNDPVIKDLRNVLKYKAFTLLDGTILRVIEGRNAEAKVGPRGEYEIQIRPQYIRDAAGDLIQTEIRFRGPKTYTSFAPVATPGNTTPAPVVSTSTTDLISTTLMLKAGEKTVVGVSKSDSDKGLILILSGKVTK